MELELGLKITRTREDVSSSVDFHFSKDPFGPLVLSQETDSSFIIIIHLKGFKKEGIEIDINEEGNRITVRGRKPIEEMVMIRWMSWMREVEFRVFKKVFRIPDLVDLDKIKARFNDDDATLTIIMPKRVKGVSGFKIEEEEEEERVDFGEVSEAGEVEEESKEREEEFGERESQVLEEEQMDEEEETEDSHEQTRHGEQELVVEQQAETNNDDFGSRVLEEIGDLEPDVLDRKTKSGAMEKEMTDYDDADGLRKVQEIEEPERHNEEEKIREMVEQKDEEENEDDKYDKIHQIDEQDYKILREVEEELTDSTEKKTTDDDGDGSSKIQGEFEEVERYNEESKNQEMVEGETCGHEKKKNVKKEFKNREFKEEFDGKMGEGFTPNIDRTKVVGEDDIAETNTNAEDFEFDKLQEDKVHKIHELLEKIEEERDTAKVRREIEDRSLKKLKDKEEEHSTGQRQHGKEEKIKELVEEQTLETNIRNDIPKAVHERCEEIKNQPEEYKEKIMETGKKINDAAAERNVQEIIRKQELDETSRCEKEKRTRELVKSKTKDDDKEIAETETKEQESYRATILGEQEKIQEVSEEKANLSINREVKEEEEIAEKKTEFCDDDDISRKGQDIEQRASDAMKEQEEKISNGGKGIIAVADTKAEDGKSKNVQEIDEQQTHEEDRCGKQFQKLIGGEISGPGGVDDVEKEKRISDSLREAQEIGKKDLYVSEEYRGIYQNEHEEENKKEEVDCKEKESSEESKTKTNDNVVRKVQGTKEHDIYEPKGGHVSKIKELVDEKTHDHEKDEDNEIDKTQITGADEPSGHGKEEEGDKSVESMPIKDNGNSVDFQEIKKERPDKPESHEKQYNIQKVVEAGDDGHKEGKVMAKAELETEEDSLKNIRETEQHEYDGLMRSLVQDKMQETEETEKDRGKEEKEIVERTKRAKDDSLKNIIDDEDPELRKPSKGQKEDKIQELVEMRTSDYREKVKKQDEDDILRSQETGRPDLGKPRNIHQLVGEEQMENTGEIRGKMVDDSSEKFHESEEVKSYENRTYEQQEKRKDLVREEETNHKDRHSGGKGYNNHKEEEKQEKVISKAEIKKQELKNEADSSKKVQEIEKQNSDGLKRSTVEDKMQTTEEKDKARDINENEIVERREKTKDVSLRKVREGEDPNLGRHGEEDTIQEFMETDRSDHREKVKKRDEDNILRSQETGKMDLGEAEIHCKPRKIHHSVEDEKGDGKMENISEPGGKMEGDDSLGKVHEFPKQKPYEDWIQEESEKEEENLVDDFTTKIQETEKEESHELEMHEKLDIVPDSVEDETGDQDDEEAEEGAALVTSNESSRKVQAIEEKSERHKEQNKIPEVSDPKVTEEDKERIAEKETKEEVPNSRINKENKELEESVQELEGLTDEERKREEKGKQGKTVDTMPHEGFKKKNDNGIRNIQETNVDESDEKINQELERKESSNDEVKQVTEDECFRKGQELSEKEPNVSKRQQTMEEEKFQELKKVEKLDQVLVDEEKAEVETKLDDGKSKKFEMSKMLELNESKENEEHKKILKPMEEKSTASETEKEGNGKIAEDEIDSRIEDQEIQENHNIEESMGKETQKHGEEEINEGGGYKTELKTRYIDQSQSQDVEKNESDKPKRYTEQENIQELMTEEEAKEEYRIREGEKNEKAETIPQVDSKANDDSLVKNGTQRHESTRLRGDKKKENHQELEEMETNEQRKEEKENEVVDKAETLERLFVEKDTSDKAKEIKSRDDSSTKKTQENEKQESYGQKRNEEQDNKKLGLVGKKTNYSGDEEDGNEDKEIAEEEEVPRKLKEIEKRELVKEVERNEDQDDIEEMVEEKMKNKEEEDEKTMIMQVLENADDHESKGQVKQGKNREQRIRDKLKDEEIAKKERKCKELEEDRIHYCRDKEKREKAYEYGSSKNIQESSEDDEEELEVEFEDEEEDWEAEVIQEMDSDEDNEKIKQIKRIRLGFRLVGGTTFFMSLIVIVISFIRSKRKIRCYKL